MLVKTWAHPAGKVLIGEKWEDPTILKPILRTLPRGWELDLGKPPYNPLTSGDWWVGVTCWLVGLIALGQIGGLL